MCYEFRCDLCDTGRHLHQRVEEHKHSVIGKHLKDEQYLRPSSLREKFKVLEKCRSKLECLTFEKTETEHSIQADFIRARLFVQIHAHHDSVHYVFFTLLLQYK